MAANNQTKSSKNNSSNNSPMTLMKKLIENHFMVDHIESQLEKDRVDYLDQRLINK